MKQQEELEAFQRFEAAHGPAIWSQVMEARLQSEGNTNSRPNWMEGIRRQNEVRAVLKARFSTEGK